MFFFFYVLVPLSYHGDVNGDMYVYMHEIWCYMYSCIVSQHKNKSQNYIMQGTKKVFPSTSHKVSKK